jgi:bacterial/archaeal transporter family protein
MKLNSRRSNSKQGNASMNSWFLYAVGAAVLYGLHQIFTKMAAERISDGLGSFVVEASAALSILLYLGWLWWGRNWNQTSTSAGVFYSVLTGICVGGGTILFFLLFQNGGPLSAVPMILAGGAAVMVAAGILFFKEPVSFSRLLGIVLAIAGLILLRSPGAK